MKNGKRELLIGAVGLVKGNVRNGGPAMLAVCNDLEPCLEKNQFLEKAPFQTVSLIFRYGLNWGEPAIGRINQKHGELEAAIEIPMNEVRAMEMDVLTNVMKKQTLFCLIAIADKYQLRSEFWKEMLLKM